MSTKTKTKAKETTQEVAVLLDAPELSVLDKSRAQQIRETFAPMADMVQEFEEAYNEIVAMASAGIDEKLTKQARNLRLSIAKIRHETERSRKQEKEVYLRAGKAIDAVSNILKWAIYEKEEELQKIEKHFEIQEAKRLEELQEKRVKELDPYVEDAHERDLAGMTDEVWDIYLAGKKKQHEDRIQAEKEAEEKRIAEEKERARIKELHDKRLKETGPFYGFWADYWEIKWGEMPDQEYKKQLEEAKAHKKRMEELDQIREERRKESAMLAPWIKGYDKMTLEDFDRDHWEEILDMAAKAKAREEAKAQEEQRKAEKAAREAAEKAAAEKKARQEAEQRLIEQQQKQQEADRLKEEKLKAGDQKKLQLLKEDLESLRLEYKFKAKTNQNKWSQIQGLLTKAIEITGK